MAKRVRPVSSRAWTFPDGVCGGRLVLFEKPRADRIELAIGRLSDISDDRYPCKRTQIFID